jgi:osmoprotectant transport system ATP-binding protein
VLFVTHDVDEAFRLADEMVVLRRGGQIAQRGTPEQILTEPADDFVREFIGAGRAERMLTLDSVGNRTIVRDGDGRPLGTVGP